MRIVIVIDIPKGDTTKLEEDCGLEEIEAILVDSGIGFTWVDVKDTKRNIRIPAFKGAKP